jgi:hypothetical protein
MTVSVESNSKYLPERTITLPHYATSCLKKHKIAQAHLKLKLGSAYQDNDLIVCSYGGDTVISVQIFKILILIQFTVA